MTPGESYEAGVLRGLEEELGIKAEDIIEYERVREPLQVETSIPEKNVLDREWTEVVFHFLRILT